MLWKGDGGGGQRRARAPAALVLLTATAVGCAEYKQVRSATKSISDVRVTTSRGEIGNCRLIGGVDSRDTARGCGLTVQPTPEECMKYQVRRAGGDTLLLGGPIGDAYDCSRSSATAAAPEPAPTTRPAPTPTSTPSTPPPPPPAATPPPKSGVRIILSRELAKGCVYLGDVDLKLACPDEPGKSSEACVSDRAIEAGGNTVFLDGGRAQIFSCEPTP